MEILVIQEFKEERERQKERPGKGKRGADEWAEGRERERGEREIKERADMDIMNK